MNAQPARDRFDLDYFKMRGDEPLDDIVTRMGKELDGFKTMALLFPRIHDLKRMSHDELEQLRRDGLVNRELVDFFDEHDRVPDDGWIDAHKIDHGGKFYREHGLLGFLVLACASLPACYCWNHEASVLNYTGKLTKRGPVPRRLAETAQLVIDVTTRHAFEPGGIAIRSAQKVRLIHAVIRYLIVRPDAIEMAIKTGVVVPDAGHGSPHHDHGDDWDPIMGAPISQEFLAATLLTFHYVVLKGLKRMGVRIGDADLHAYLHRWNVLGLLMGIDDRILRRLDTMENARALFDEVMRRHCERTEAAFTLEAALLDFQRDNVIEKLPGGRLRPLAHTPAIVTHALCTRETCHAVFLQLNGYELFWYLPVWFWIRIVAYLDNWAVFQWVTRGIIARVSLRIWGWRYENQAESQQSIDSGDWRPRGRIVIPSSLIEDWKLKTTPHSSNSRK